MSVRRLRLSRARGFRLPENAVSVARPGKWGNPFIVGKDGTQLQCVALFVALAGGFIDLSGRVPPDEQLEIWRRLRRSIRTLAGKDLACWCALGTPCHADVLLHLANDGVPFPLAGQEVDIGRARIGIDARQLQRLKLKHARERSEAA